MCQAHMNNQGATRTSFIWPNEVLQLISLLDILSDEVKCKFPRSREIVYGLCIIPGGFQDE